MFKKFPEPRILEKKVKYEKRVDECLKQWRQQLEEYKLADEWSELIDGLIEALPK